MAKWKALRAVTTFESSSDVEAEEETSISNLSCADEEHVNDDFLYHCHRTGM